MFFEICKKSWNVLYKTSRNINTSISKIYSNREIFYRPLRGKNIHIKNVLSGFSGNKYLNVMWEWILNRLENVESEGEKSMYRKLNWKRVKLNYFFCVWFVQVKVHM